MGNVTKEIIAEGPHAGASIDLDKVLSGDNYVIIGALGK